jgi:predicted ATPase/DNA-binding winged helix-turn-helix (wHTH) protein
MPKFDAGEASAIAFGPFTLVPRERLLLHGAEPVEVSARAFDILVALTAEPNAVLTKAALMDSVWPDVTVGEGSLRFHMANLRKALGDGRGGARYIATLPGRGYCFVAPLSRAPADGTRSVEKGFAATGGNLPNRPLLTVGRDGDVRVVGEGLRNHRCVTIVGPGGVGKTTVALEVAHAFAAERGGAVLLLDLGLLRDPAMVAVTLASLLGVPGDTGDTPNALLASLRHAELLLVLDTCEHVIEAAADLVGRILAEAPAVYVLSTSREPLQVGGEMVHRLQPLASPSCEEAVTAEALPRYPATRLFMERTVATGVPAALTDAEAGLVADICRKLDGMPLAIELAARRVGSFGLAQTAALLGERLALAWPGQRDAPPRQRSLQATLAWSFDLLSEGERDVLRRLAVFVGDFTIEAAFAVATERPGDHAALLDALDSLVAKSLVAARPIGAMMRYRLLDTTRAFALQAGEAEPINDAVAERHAGYCLRWLDDAGLEWSRLSTATQRARHWAGLSNVKAALDWCFGANGDAVLGRQLVARAAPILLGMSLLPECHRWTERALETLDADSRGSREEMLLQSALGVSLMFMRGGKDAARHAHLRALAIADDRGNALDQVQVLGPLQMFHLRTGDFRAALACARRCSVLAGALADPAAAAMSHAILGISFHLAGDLARARQELEAALAWPSDRKRAMTLYLGLDGRVLAGAILARTLWLQGEPGRAAEQARRAVTAAAAMDHALTLCIALSWAITVFDWTGDDAALADHVDRLAAHSGRSSFAPYLAVAEGWRGVAAVRRGDVEAGVEALRDSIERLHAMPYELLTTPLVLALIDGLRRLGQPAEATMLAQECKAAIERCGDFCYRPELLRLEAALDLVTSPADTRRAEALLKESIADSRAQGARGWELRSATTLAGILARSGRQMEAHAVLGPILDAFTEHMATADVAEAAGLMVAAHDHRAI